VFEAGSNAAIADATRAQAPNAARTLTREKDEGMISEEAENESNEESMRVSSWIETQQSFSNDNKWEDVKAQRLHKHPNDGESEKSRMKGVGKSENTGSVYTLIHTYFINCRNLRRGV
jgi:hypothetical protein